MNKEQRKNIKDKYFNTEDGKSMYNRLMRLIITGVIGIFFSIYLIYSNYTTDGNNIWQYIMAGILIIASIIFILGSIKIRLKVLNKFALKNSK